VALGTFVIVSQGFRGLGIKIGSLCHVSCEEQHCTGDKVCGYGKWAFHSNFPRSGSIGI
jgi:hypothetical protein